MWFALLVVIVDVVFRFRHLTFVAVYGRGLYSAPTSVFMLKVRALNIIHDDHDDEYDDDDDDDDDNGDDDDDDYFKNSWEWVFSSTGE